ncbi:hypothetical protein [Portibacter marinus]|uniref:hypothetical protein n=1 Tax=Portibacter marinus TaxID=2898660 RepID=UPI001F45DC8C|nr:hypothetical protein [Portibacter marinus]
MTAYSVYVVELSRKVWTENRKFREANPQFNGVVECLYVGMTSLTPEQRFKKHKTNARSLKGHKIASNLVLKYGLYLRPSLYRHLNPMNKTQAMDMEVQLSKILKRQRYAVWYN